jgi:flagellin
LGSREAVGGGGASQELLRNFSFASVDDITIDFETPLTAGIEVELTDAANMDDIVRLVNAEIQARAAAGDDDSVVIANAALQASLRVGNDGATTVVITSAFDAEAFDVGGGQITFDDPDGSTADLFETAVTAAQVNLTEIDVTTRDTAAQALGAVDGALTQVNTLRAELGAVQIRFENTISNLSVSVENQSAARSRIRDADFAAETAELTRAQILQQAGISVLSQANASPQSVLALLQ